MCLEIVLTPDLCSAAKSGGNSRADKSLGYTRLGVNPEVARIAPRSCMNSAHLINVIFVLGRAATAGRLGPE